MLHRTKSPPDGTERTTSQTAAHALAAVLYIVTATQY